MRPRKSIFKKAQTENGPEKLLKELPGGADLKNLLGDINRILDPLDVEVIIVQKKGCKVVFTNSRAKARIRNNQGRANSCNTGYAAHFQNLCVHCPYSWRSKETGQRNHEIEDKDKRRYSIKSSIINWIDNEPAAVFILRDITADVEANERLYTLAYFDQLTGVPNRQRLKDDFGAMELRIANNELSGIVALCDLDFFKSVNDTYGHNTGDSVLRLLTEQLQGDKTFRGHIYRLGGDEFVLLYFNPAGKFKSEQEIKKHYNNLLSAALRAYTLPNIDVKCTLSIGVSIFPVNGSSLSEVLRKADIALYQAKASGRNKIVFFTDQADSAQKLKEW